MAGCPLPLGDLLALDHHCPPYIPESHGSLPHLHLPVQHGLGGQYLKSKYNNYGAELSSEFNQDLSLKSDK